MLRPQRAVRGSRFFYPLFLVCLGSLGTLFLANEEAAGNVLVLLDITVTSRLPFGFGYGSIGAWSGWEVGSNGQLSVQVDENGVVIPPPKFRGKLRHPMHGLIEQGRRKWDAMLKR